MKKRIMCLLIAVMAVIMWGCGPVAYDITQVGDNTTIKIKDVPDGKYGETGYFSVGKNEAVSVESSLIKGQLMVEFVSVAVIMDSTNNRETVVENFIAQTVKVGPGDSLTVSLERGEYIMHLTAEGQTDGTVSVKVVKK